MNVIIEDDYLSDLVNIEKQRTGKKKYPIEVEDKFIQRVGFLRSATNENDLRKAKSLHFEKLTGSFEGKYSIRINKSWRIVLRIDKEGFLKVLYVEELNNHYKD